LRGLAERFRFTSHAVSISGLKVGTKKYRPPPKIGATCCGSLASYDTNRMDILNFVPK
jgi:hypothetical protein